MHPLRLKSSLVPTLFVASAAVVVGANLIVRGLLIGKDLPAVEWAVLAAAVLIAVALVGVLAWQRGAKTDTDKDLFKTSSSFVAGVIIGAIVRSSYGHGTLHISSFCNATAPLIAGLFVGIVFAGSSDRASDPAKRGLQRALALLYMLSGAVATAVGNIPETGWVFGCCFLAVWGSLMSSCYVMFSWIAGSD